VLISEIMVGPRVRRDMGDLDALAASIADVGLLQPIVVKPDGTLVAGQRRLEACKRLGWDDVPVHVVRTASDALKALKAERDENTCRKDFTPSEAVAVASGIEPLERQAARERQAAGRPSEKFTEGKRNPQALDFTAAAVGLSRPTLQKARAVVEAAEREPERYKPIREQMDRTGKVDGAYKELRRAIKQEAKAATPDLPEDGRTRLLTGDFRDAIIEPGSVDAIITDPPYPREYLPLYGDLAHKAAEWLKPGGSLLVMCGQSYLPDVLALLGSESALAYHWTLAYLTPGGQAVQLWPRKVNTFWKPVLWYVKGEYCGDWIGDVAKSAPNDNDKRFHDWGQSESGMADLLERFTYPGQMICDPFCGGGTTGVVAAALRRRFIGIDTDTSAIATTNRRIAEVLAHVE
jgi:ParB-like chromosome segregation protein Spo0J